MTDHTSNLHQVDYRVRVVTRFFCKPRADLISQLDRQERCTRLLSQLSMSTPASHENVHQLEQFPLTQATLVDFHTIVFAVPLSLPPCYEWFDKLQKSAATIS